MSDSPLDFASQPHDAFFKGVFRQPEQAAAFFQGHLPKELVARIDWTSLKLLPGSFVDNSLRQAHSDLLFEVNTGCDQVFLYLLFEHQTTVDPAMPLRLLQYMLEIWQAHMKNQGLPLPPVLPFVLHQGPQAWAVSTQFEDLLQMPEGLAEALLPHMPKFSHALLDLTQFDPAQEEDHKQMRAVLQLMKLARGKNLLEFFKWLATQGTDPMPITLLRLSLMYALHTNNHIDVEKIYHTLDSNPSLKEQTMSIAQQLKAEGKAEGNVVGKLQMLQEVMGLPVSGTEELNDLNVTEVQERFEALQREYQARYKNR